MLKKMRWRFIGAAMAAFGAVVLTLLCFINVWNYRTMAQQQDETLQMLLEIEQRQTPFPSSQGMFLEGWRHFSPEVQYSLRFFSVRCTHAGEIVQVNQDYVASVSREDAERYAKDVLASGRTHGFENGYRYLAESGGLGTTILFLNSERELQAAKSLLVITLAIAGICLGVVFGLVVYFSGHAIRPYLKNLEAQKQFITNASHELKTPLTAIATSADVLAMETPEDEWVKNIQTQAARLSKLITNLITLSRLDEENPFPARAEFSLSDMLWEVTEPFVSLAQAKGRRYTQEIEDGLTITADREAVGQMVSILLDNAFKYSPPGGAISLQLRRRARRAELLVQNSFAGELPDAARLFDRFYRADESHSGHVGGTGIGLSIARATAEAHGGSIAAETEGGEITFRVLLPLSN